jgi:hypothetical protein
MYALLPTDNFSDDSLKLFDYSVHMPKSKNTGDFAVELASICTLVRLQETMFPA